MLFPSLDIKKQVCNRKKIIKNKVVLFFRILYQSIYSFLFQFDHFRLIPRYRGTCSGNNNREISHIPSLYLTKRSIRVSRSGNFFEEERYRGKRREEGAEEGRGREGFKKRGTLMTKYGEEDPGRKFGG